MLCTGADIAASAEDGTGVVISDFSASSSSAAETLDLVSARYEESAGVETEIERLGAQAVKLSWKSRETYLSYTVCRYNGVSGSWEPVCVTNERKAVIRGLKENTDYKIAVMNSVDGSILGVENITTGLKKAELKVVSVSSDSVKLNIKNVDENTRVDVLRSEDGKPYEKAGTAQNGIFTDNNLKPETSYSYRVKLSPLSPSGEWRPRKSTKITLRTLKRLELPKDSDGSCKTYAYYTAVTAKGSPQYKLLRSEQCYTDEETGIRMYDGCYCAALGSFYGTKIGTKYKITLQDGDEVKSFNIILCDQKSDRHTNDTHQYARRNKDVVEFYVEKAKIPSGIRGDYGTTERFRGKIIDIEQYVEE
ncbi:MAG: fibronectin type III domain-containing protein [Eubacterium sp.]|nr:fibronectin type III domain-containing protein [Eubacterium sp.]